MNLQPSYPKILSLLTQERFDAFKATKEESDLDTLARYLWNIALSESLYPSLHLLEIILRNSIHSALSNHFGDDWLLRTGPSGILMPSAQTDVAKVIKRLRKDKKIITPSRVIAGLSLGFWVFLFGKHYEFIFWRKNLKTVFPNLTRQECNRKDIQQKLLTVWHLRNRMSHHEQIIHWQQLLAAKSNISQLIAGISSDTLLLSQQIDRFNTVYSGGWQVFIAAQAK